MLRRDEAGAATQTALVDAVEATTVRWQLDPEWPQRLGLVEADFGRWLANQSAQPVKVGTHRQVFRVDSGRQQLYVKRYRSRRGLARLAMLARGTPARREWRKAIELARRGIATAAAVAVGESYRGGIPGDSLLVTRGIEASRPLDDFLKTDLPDWPAAQQLGARRYLTIELARVLAGCHRAGVRHDDLHAGNILVAIDRLAAAAAPTYHVSSDSPPPLLYLIDLPEVRFGRPLRRRASLASVVMLAAGLWSQATPRERWRFWRTYLANRPELAVEDRGNLAGRRAARRQVAQQLVADVLRYQRALYRSRDRRSLAENRDFKRIAGRGITWHALRGVAPHELAATSELEERLVLGNRWRWFPWREHPARRLWRLAQGLLARGIGIQGPVAALVPSRFSGRREGALFFPKESAPTPLAELLAAAAVDPSLLDARDRRELARACGELLGSLHRWQVITPRLSLASFAVRRASVGPQLVLADWTTARVPKLTSRRAAEPSAARDLAALQAELTSQMASSRSPVSRSELARALQAYVVARWQSPGAWRDLWRKLAAEQRVNLNECRNAAG